MIFDSTVLIRSHFILQHTLGSAKENEEKLTTTAMKYLSVLYETEKQKQPFSSGSSELIDVSVNDSIAFTIAIFFFNQIQVEDYTLDHHSSPSLPRRRSTSRQPSMANAYLRSRRVSILTRQSSTTEPIKPQTVPPKVLVFTGKCSEIFKSTLEECVEDCILQFSGEAAIYVPKVGPALPLSTASRSNSIVGSKDTLSHLQGLNRLQRRQSSTNSLNSLVSGSTRTHQVNQFSLPTVAMAATRIRHQLVPQKFSFSENISEETSDVQTTIEAGPTPTMVEVEPEHLINHPEETISHPSNFDTLSQSISCSRPKLPASPTHPSYRDRQKDYRLSDLVMLGPEHYAHVFNLSRPSRSVTTRASTRQQRSTTAHPKNKTAEKYDELDQIKQDLFHRYLWTQKPQVSCRIRPISTYTRSTTFVL